MQVAWCHQKCRMPWPAQLLSFTEGEGSGSAPPRETRGKTWQMFISSWKHDGFKWLYMTSNDFLGFEYLVLPGILKLSNVKIIVKIRWLQDFCSLILFPANQWWCGCVTHPHTYTYTRLYKHIYNPVDNGLRSNNRGLFKRSKWCLNQQKQLDHRPSIHIGDC